MIHRPVPLRFLPVCLLILCVSTLSARAQPAPQPLRLSPTAWEFTTAGRYEAWTDRRHLLVLHHPWAVSEKGFAATAEQTVTIPEGWDLPVRLHFYASDDYDGSMDPVSDNWLGQINLPGHRFKEVLVNGEAVWRQDVADSADIAAPVRFSVELPASVVPGTSVKIAFRMADEIGSMDRLEGDHRYIGDTDNITEDEPWKFMTNLYIGDVTLTPASIPAVSPQNMPAVDLARAEHGDRWPLKPVSAPADFPVRLKVRRAPESRIPTIVQCGVPFPLGALLDPAAIRLSDTNGAPIPASARTMSTWPNGSVRFARVTAVLPPGCDEVQLDIRPDADVPAAPESRIHTTFSQPDQELSMTLDNGEENRVVITGEYTINGEPVAAILESVETVEESALHQEIKLHGRLKGATASYGKFVCRITTFSGLPHIRVTHRIINEHPGTLEVTRMALRLKTAPRAAVRSVPGTLTRVAQRDTDTHALEYADRPAEVRDGQAIPWFHPPTHKRGTGVSSIVRDFAAQHPIAQGMLADGIRIELFAPTEQEPAYRPHEGEAKRHEIWLTLWNEERSEWNGGNGAPSLANAPAGLFDADYFCATGAFGMAAPHDEARFPELTAFMRQTYGDIPASMFYKTGIRHFGDLPYNAEEGTWRNGYYDVQQGLFSEYLMTGDDRWFDHLEASVRHIMDVDICHAFEEHPKRVGAIYGPYSKDHSLGDPWNPTQRTKGTLNYWRLTGDRDARDAALGVADSAIAAKRAIGATSVRDHAGILYCLVAAYDETRAQKYLDAAREVAHDAMKRIDPRRGCYAEIHGNYSYRGNVPWMVAQLMEPLYDYYRASGDVDAAAAVVGMAESILAENRTRDVPGDVYGYSHNPHFNKNSGYHILIAPAILYAHELTGDDEFLRQGRAMYDQTIAEGTVNSVMNCYWNTHTLLYYLSL